MKKYFALYSRTYSIDYRWIALPDNKVCPEEILTVFKNKAENLLQDGVYYDEKDNPAWLYIKEQEYVLWGFATLNQELSGYCWDNSKTRIRCFCGFIAIPEESDNALESLPYSTEAFMPIFKEVMGKTWDGKKTVISNVIFVANEYDDKSINRASINNINRDNHICRFFPYTPDKEKLIGACLASSDNISIAVNVKKESQVYNAKPLSLLNAVMQDPEYIKTDKIIQSKCSICNKWFDKIVDGKCDDCRKKEPELSNRKEKDWQITPNISKEVGKSESNTDEGTDIECNKKYNRKVYVKYCFYFFCCLLACIPFMHKCRHHHSYTVQSLINVNSEESERESDIHVQQVLLKDAINDTCEDKSQTD